MIYGAGIKKAIDTKNYGSIYYQVHNVYMEAQDRDQVLLELWNKIESGEELMGEDMGKLVLLPFMHSMKSRVDMAIDSAYIASKKRPRKAKSNLCLYPNDVS